MSILEFPRAYFRGEIAWDPVTTNNYPSGQAPAAYDETNCDSLINTNRVMSAAQVSSFRSAAINEVASKGNWNPDGSYRCPFYNTFVSGADLGDGLVVTDAFTSAPVIFTGMLVDCEPYGAYSSQLFFDDMSFGILGGCRIFGKRAIRCNDRFINFQANPSNNIIAGVASVMWQTVFPKDQGLQIDPFDSNVLKRFQSKMQDPDVLGVMVRFVTYRTIYYNDPTLSNGLPSRNAGKAFEAVLQAGGFQPNPARSKLVGTVGLWRRGDCATEASDRALIATFATIPGQPSAANGGPVVATAFARATEKGLALDFSNTIPYSDRATDKFNLGTLTLTASDPPPAVAVAQVATIDYSHYDRAAFEATSGIIDVPLSPGQIALLANTNLAISGGDGTSYLQEDVLRAVPTAPNLYMDQGQNANLIVQVYQRGVPAGSGIAVTMSDMNSTQSGGWRLLTNANGQVNFALSGSQPGITGWVFQTGDNPTLPIGNAFTPLNFTYSYQRVLPADDNIASLPPTWTNTYNYVLANWHAMAPCMDNWLRLGDEQQVRAYAPLIKRLTDPANFELFRYMPVTRDLTAGQRTLLYNFLNSPATVAADAGGVVGPPTTAKALVETAPTAATIDSHRLSRAMRSGGVSDEPES